MQKIRNDPSRYVTRSHAFAPKRRRSPEIGFHSEAREKEFLTMPVGQGGYIKFSSQRADKKS
jgi:hypothetical protein